MRCQAVVGLAFVLAAMGGCRRECFLTEYDCDHYQAIGLPADLEANPAAGAVPAAVLLPSPPTVISPERKVRYLSLAEAIAMALEHGSVGSPALNGTTNDNLVFFQGQTIFSPESPIRVLALEPAIAGTDIEAALAKFDARWTTSMTWSRTDEPVATPLETFEAGPFNKILNHDASLSTALIKPLPTGGLAGITFHTDYELTNLPARVNPAYQPSLQFQFEQPLLQGFGVEINQLRAQHPGSLLTPFPTGSRVDGILITRVRFDQQRAEFERQVHLLLANVEIAYWNLYEAYWNLYSREQGQRQAYDAWRINKLKFEAGGDATIQDIGEARGQYELFRGQWLDALGQVLESEHQLRGLLGLPVEDGTRLVPIDEPTLAPYQPDWSAALNEALSLRPELVLARQDLKLRQLDLINQKNTLLPDLRFTSTYNVNGVGTHLDGGSDPTNAFHSFAANDFHDWTLGLRLDMPIGARDAHAAVRAARLRLAQSYATLRDQEYKAQRFLDQQYRQLFQSYTQIQTQRAQREALGLALKGRFTEFVHGKKPLIVLLEAQRFYADALRSEYAAVVDYNNALARFEFAKGTIMQRDNVVISEGNLPHCAQVRAVEHERRRSKALVLRERAKPVQYALYPSPAGACTGLPQLPASGAPSLPALFAGQPALPNDTDSLPIFRPIDPAKKPSGEPLNVSPVPAGPKSAAPVNPLAVSLGQPVPYEPSASQAVVEATWRPAAKQTAPSASPQAQILQASGSKIEPAQYNFHNANK